MAITITQGISKPNGITGTLTGISNAGGISAQGGGVPPVSCAYPLDATAGEIMGAGLVPLVMTDSFRTGTYTVVGGPMVNVIAMAFAKNASLGTSKKLDFTTGKKAIQYAVDLPASEVVAVGQYKLSVDVYTPAFAKAAQVDISIDTTLGFYATVYIGAGSPVYAEALATPPTLIDFLFDAPASTVYVRFDGIVVASGSYTPAELISIIQANEQTTCDPLNAGKTVSINQRTYAGAIDVTVPFPAGYTSVCGEAFEVFYLTDSVGDYPTDDAGDYLIGA